jgi:hypothetical protein
MKESKDEYVQVVARGDGGVVRGGQGLDFGPRGGSGAGGGGDERRWRTYDEGFGGGQRSEQSARADVGAWGFIRR